MFVIIYSSLGSVQESQILQICYNVEHFSDILFHILIFIESRKTRRKQLVENTRRKTRRKATRRKFSGGKLVARTENNLRQI